VLASVVYTGGHIIAKVVDTGDTHKVEYLGEFSLRNGPNEILTDQGKTDS
jgi:hypothetical protein